MGKKNRYIELSSEERKELEIAFKTGNSHDFRNRCHCILLSDEKWSVKELKGFFNVTALAVYKWFDRYEAEGLQGLYIRPGRGRKRKLNIDNSIHVEVVKIGLAKENRSIKQLKEELESQLNTTIGNTTLRDFLKVLVSDTEDLDTV
jgi:transposase